MNLTGASLVLVMLPKPRTAPLSGSPFVTRHAHPRRNTVISFSPRLAHAKYGISVAVVVLRSAGRQSWYNAEVCAESSTSRQAESARARGRRKGGVRARTAGLLRGRLDVRLAFIAMACLGHHFERVHVEEAFAIECHAGERGVVCMCICIWAAASMPGFPAPMCALTSCPICPGPARDPSRWALMQAILLPMHPRTRFSRSPSVCPPGPVAKPLPMRCSAGSRRIRTTSGAPA